MATMRNTVTLEDIESKIKGDAYLVLPDGKSTLCILTLENGYTIKGVSACVDAANFDFLVGRKIAREDAIRQIWPLEGYLLAQALYEAEKLYKEANKGFVKSPSSEATAPWGLKKDGTPKKRPGRAKK